MSCEEEGTVSILRLPLFHGYGVELEYMIVDRNTLNVKPVTDKLFYAMSGSYLNEVENGDIGWSNELALHVLEFKTPEPVTSLSHLDTLFQQNIVEANKRLEAFNAQLMPTGMHPWMDPYTEMSLWPHEQNAIYDSFHRIFDCRGHGWANLQSVHLNLPFSNDVEFGQLHAAIRLLLPLMPALAASSPIMDGSLTGAVDSRLEVYLQNSAKIPSITGDLIPEPIRTKAEYEDVILNRIYKDIAPHDPEKILQHEWLNSRGAIARFDRYTIEIRVLDVQECPVADLAVLQLIINTLKALIHQKWSSLRDIHEANQGKLVKIFLDAIKDGEKALIQDSAFLRLFGVFDQTKLTIGELWQHIADSVKNQTEPASAMDHALDIILSQGPLARRIQQAFAKNPSRTTMQDIYRQLCHCLHHGEMFSA
jgi:gamma-glutamyl:cysteine ligase YbdK (ATP-grasp superfamily)